LNDFLLSVGEYLARQFVLRIAPFITHKPTNKIDSVGQAIGPKIIADKAYARSQEKLVATSGISLIRCNNKSQHLQADSGRHRNEITEDQAARRSVDDCGI
jgi:hypothetical protein